MEISLIKAYYFCFYSPLANVIQQFFFLTFYYQFKIFDLINYSHSIIDDFIQIHFINFSLLYFYNDFNLIIVNSI